MDHSVVQIQQLDKDVFDAVNQARTNPKSLIPMLEQMLPQFKGKILHRPGKIDLMTNEGAAVVKETIEFLNKQKPCEALSWSQELISACKDHTDDIGPHGKTSHDGTNGSTMSSRIQKYGQYQVTAGENLSFGEETGMGVVLQLIVDDGVSSRGHRKNIYNNAFKVFGCYSGPHKVYQTMTCMDFAGGISQGGAGGDSSTSSSSSQSVLDAFMKEHVEMEKPQGAKSISDSIECSSDGETMVKKITRTIVMHDGSTKTITKTITRSF